MGKAAALRFWRSAAKNGSSSTSTFPRQWPGSNRRRSRRRRRPRRTTKGGRSANGLLAFLQRDGELVALHVEDGLQRGIGADCLHIVRDHIDVVRQDESSRTHQREYLRQILHVALFFRVDEHHVEGSLQLPDAL